MLSTDTAITTSSHTTTIVALTIEPSRPGFGNLDSLRVLHSAVIEGTATAARIVSIVSIHVSIDVVRNVESEIEISKGVGMFTVFVFVGGRVVLG